MSAKCWLLCYRVVETYCYTLLIIQLLVDKRLEFDFHRDVRRNVYFLLINEDIARPERPFSVNVLKNNIIRSQMNSIPQVNVCKPVPVITNMNSEKMEVVKAGMLSCPR